MNLAIIIGVENYESEKYDNLPACKNDANGIKAVLENVKDIEKILFFNNGESATSIKREITNFVEEYEGKDINELFFYFTGHGERDIQEKDRDINDFLYILYDFDNNQPRVTSLKNSDLDNWAKTLSPKLFVKIVDSCFSGTQYIKSGTDEEYHFKKSAKKYGLNDIHFWFSSRENQKSLADENLSKFTESILLAIHKFKGETRYRELKDFIADDFDGKNIAKPYFINQSNNTEKFGNITSETHQIVDTIFYGEEGNTNLISKKNKELKDEEKLNIFDLAINQSDKLCFSEETLIKFIENFNKNILSWDNDFKKIYTIKITSYDSTYVPNHSQIGEWLSQNQSDNYFAEPSYKNQDYKVQEYIELPQKPRKDRLRHYSDVSYAISNIIGGRKHPLFDKEEEKEYKLETVTKNKSYINGFNYTHFTKEKIKHISFIPKIEIVDPLSLYIVPIYSNRNLIIHIAYETLKKDNWKDFSSPKCQNWKLIQVDINADKSAKNTAKRIQEELKKWFENILSKKLD